MSRWTGLGLLFVLVAPAADPLPPGARTRIGDPAFRLTSHFSQVFLTPDGSTVVGNRQGQTVHLWDAATGKVLGDFRDPDLNQWTADLSPDGKFLALFGVDQRGKPAPDTTLRVYDLATRKPVWEGVIEEPDRGSRAVRFTPDGKRLVTAAQDLRVWDAATGRELRKETVPLQGHPFDVSPDGRTVAFPIGREIHLWDTVAGGAPRKVPVGGRYGPDLVRFSPDGKTVYVGGPGSATLLGFDVATGKPASELAVGPVRWAAFSPDGKTVATGSVSTGGRLPREFGVTLCDAGTGKVVGRLETGSVIADAGAWSRDGKRFAALTSNRLWVWDTATGKPLGGPPAGHDALVTALAFAGADRLLTASNDTTVRAWDVGTGKELFRLPMPGRVRGLDVSPDGSLVAANGLRDALRVWDAKTGKEVFKLRGHGEMGWAREVRFSADEQTLLSFGEDANLRTWDPLTGKLKADHALKLSDAPGVGAREVLAGNRAVALSPDGVTLAVGARKEVRLFAADTGKERARLAVEGQRVSNLGFAPDGKRLVTVGWDGSDVGPAVTVWDLARGEPLVRFRSGPKSYLTIAAFTPDGKRVVTDAHPPALQFWDATTGAAIGTVPLPERPERLAFAAEGKLMAIALADATVLVYDVAAALQPVKKE